MTDNPISPKRLVALYTLFESEYNGSGFIGFMAGEGVQIRASSAEEVEPLGRWSQTVHSDGTYEWFIFYEGVRFFAISKEPLPVDSWVDLLDPDEAYDVD